jgi:esterase
MRQRHVTAKLHSSSIGQGPNVVLLHGLFGSGSNLGALARSLQDRFHVHSVDLPDHGRSDWQDTTDLASLAASLRHWMQHQGVGSACFVGHSLGGKVAMQLALDYPALVEALVVADIAPVAYPPGHDAVFAALDAVVERRCRSREEAAAVMAEHLQEAGVIQFLLMSLRRGSDGSYTWRFNLQGIREGYASLREAPGAAAPFSGPVLFIKGGDSDYIREVHRTHILALFPAAQVKIMPGCGHWLHAERPSLFNGIVGRFLQDAVAD